MKLREFSLIFSTPVLPISSFRGLKESENKSLICLYSFMISAITFAAIHYIDESANISNKYLFFYAAGFIFKLLLVGLFLTALINRIIVVPFKIVECLSIVSISSLVFIIGPMLKVLLNIENPELHYIGIFIFFILIIIGTNEFYKGGIIKHTLIALMSIIITFYLGDLFTGISI